MYVLLWIRGYKSLYLGILGVIIYLTQGRLSVTRLP